MSSTYEAARKAHPDIRVSEAAFTAFWSKCEGAPPERSADVLLAAGIVHADGAALTWLKNWVHATAAGLAGRRVPQQLVADIESQLLHVIAVADGDNPPRVASYRGRGPLEGWLRVVAMRTARTLSAHRAQSLDDDELERIVLEQGTTPDPELQALRQRYRGAIAPALRSAATKLSPRHRALISMHYLDELSIDEIGAAYAVHRATAARWLTQARQSFVEATRDSVCEGTGIGRLEVDSLVRAVQSQLDLSLRVLLSEKPPP